MEKYDSLVACFNELVQIVSDIDKLKTVDSVDSAKMRLRKLFQMIDIKSAYVITELDDAMDNRKAKIMAEDIERALLG